MNIYMCYLHLFNSICMFRLLPGSEAFYDIPQGETGPAWDPSGSDRWIHVFILPKFCRWAEVDHLSVAAKDKKPTTANSWASKMRPQRSAGSKELWAMGCWWDAMGIHLARQKMESQGVTNSRVFRQHDSQVVPLDLHLPWCSAWSFQGTVWESAIWLVGKSKSDYKLWVLRNDAHASGDKAGGCDKTIQNCVHLHDSSWFYVMWRLSVHSMIYFLQLVQCNQSKIVSWQHIGQFFNCYAKDIYQDVFDLFELFALKSRCVDTFCAVSECLAGYVEHINDFSLLLRFTLWRTRIETNICHFAKIKKC